MGRKPTGQQLDTIQCFSCGAVCPLRENPRTGRLHFSCNGAIDDTQCGDIHTFGKPQSRKLMEQVKANGDSQEDGGEDDAEEEDGDESNAEEAADAADGDGDAAEEGGSKAKPSGKSTRPKNAARRASGRSAKAKRGAKPKQTDGSDFWD